MTPLRRFSSVELSAPDLGAQGAPRPEREEADALADKLLAMTARPVEELVAVINERWRRRNKLGRAFIVHLVQRLRDQDPAVMAVIDRLEQHLAEHGLSVEQLRIAFEHG